MFKLRKWSSKEQSHPSFLGVAENGDYRNGFRSFHGNVLALLAFSPAKSVRSQRYTGAKLRRTTEVDLPVTGLAIVINIQTMARLTLNYRDSIPASCGGAVHCAAQNLTLTLQAMEANWKLDSSLHHIIIWNHNHPFPQLLPPVHLNGRGLFKTRSSAH